MTFAGLSALIVLSAVSPHSIFPQMRSAGRGGATPNADSQSVQNHEITVSRGGEAVAKPDLGILVMSLRSSSPIADEAVANNGRKAKDAQSALTGLGFAPTGFQISSVKMGQAGAARIPGQTDVTVYEATQYVYVFFEGADLNDVGHLTEKAASVIEALRKAGAEPANLNAGPIAAQGSLIIYTVKDPTEYEHKALQVAIARARDAAQDIAVGTGVQLGGLRNVQTSYLSGSSVAPRTGAGPLEGLGYRWFTSKNDELQISANVTLEYDFK
jgi:uncharacterized protein YggE